ncbi:hypothetical protein DFH06DRAFT_988166, partial [Mycena polygramma]
MSGYLRQELRELELLDEITRLKCEGRLPQQVTGLYRRRLIRNYCLWKGNNADPEHLHPAARHSKGQDPGIPEDIEYDQWRPSGAESKKRRRPSISNADVPERLPKKQRNKLVDLSPESTVVPVGSSRGLTGLGDEPVGLIWDSVNYSCGYDTVFTVLANVWSEKSDVWSRRFRSYSLMLFQLSGNLSECVAGSLTFEECRNRVRSRMHSLRPNDFPYGPRGTSMDLVSLALVPKDTYASKKAVCDRC